MAGLLRSPSAACYCGAKFSCLTIPLVTVAWIGGNFMGWSLWIAVLQRSCIGQIIRRGGGQPSQLAIQKNHASHRIFDGIAYDFFMDGLRLPYERPLF